MQRQRLGLLALVWAGAVLFSASFVPSLWALDQETKGRLADSKATVNISPLILEGGSSLTLISPQQWASLGGKLTAALQETHDMHSKLFGIIPAFETSLRLLDEETFFLSTGAPHWTNALFYRNQIIIPMPAKGEVDYDNVLRSIRHEYTHAVIHALSDGRCPGWLDEGLAQWAEGAENPALRPALAHHLQRSKPVPLAILQGGFTRLSRDIVAASYAQSLIAANTVMDNFGPKPVRSYFDLLKAGADKEYAFGRAFGIDVDVFEDRLGQKLTSWSTSLRQRSPDAPVVAPPRANRPSTARAALAPR